MRPPLFGGGVRWGYSVYSKLQFSFSDDIADAFYDTIEAVIDGRDRGAVCNNAFEIEEGVSGALRRC